VTGIVVYAVDTLLMQRKRFWNHKHIFLDGSIPGWDSNIAKRPDCKLCQPQKAALLLTGVGSINENRSDAKLD
jgi:hypothetical protein